jgi:hypothetical protein
MPPQIDTALPFDESKTIEQPLPINNQNVTRIQLHLLVLLFIQWVSLFTKTSNDENIYLDCLFCYPRCWYLFNNSRKCSRCFQWAPVINTNYGVDYLLFIWSFGYIQI